MSHKPARTGPLSSWTVLLVSEKFWTASTTPDRLRALGARIVRKPTAAMTHVGTPHEVQDRHLAAVDELFLPPRARQAIEQARQFVAEHGLTVKFLGPAALQAAVIDAEVVWEARKEAARAAREAATADRLAAAPVAGFVGV